MHSTAFLADLSSRLDAASTVIDRLVSSDDPEVSYAATTAALHLHAAQGELPMPDEPTPPAADGNATRTRVADALNHVIALINDGTASLPTGQQAALARVALHVAEARDALSVGT